MSLRTSLSLKASRSLYFSRLRLGPAFGACAALVLLMGLPGRAFGQTDQDTASARAAATAGAQAFEAGNWKRAVDYFERAESLVHSPVHLWYLASASAKLGRLVTAQEKCTKVRREGLPSGASSGLVNSYEGCGDLLEDLEGRVPSLTVELEGLPEGAEFELKRNGTKLATATVGVPVPSDPGSYTFEGLAEGYRAHAAASVAEGKKQTVVLTFTADPSAHLSKPVNLEPIASAGTTQPVPPHLAPSPAAGARRGPPLGSYLSWVLGAGAVGAGVAATVAAADTGKQIDALCGGDRTSCMVSEPEEQVRVAELKGNEQTYYILSGVAYGAGGIGIITGFLIWALQPSQATAAFQSSRATGAFQPSKATTARPSRGFEVTPVFGLQEIGLTGRF